MTLRSALDVAALLASDWPSPTYRAALMVLSTMHKAIPGVPSDDPDDPEPFDVDWDVLEENSGPWSTSERLRVGLARSIAEGDINGAAWSLDEQNWHVFLDALRVARYGVVA